MTITDRWRRPSGWLLRLAGLMLLVSGLIATLVIDVDGDPSTTNVASVVVSVETSIVTNGDASQETTEPGVTRSRKTRTRFSRKVGAWLGVGQHRWHPHVRPIRGP
jgi:hypothetical protein